MGFFDLEDSTAVMPFTLWLLKVFGLRGSRWAYRRYQFAIFCICFVTLVPKMFLGYRNDTDLIIRGVSELIFQGNIVIKMVIFGWRRKEFERMLGLLRKWFKKTFQVGYTSAESTVLAKCNRATDIFAKGYFTYCMVVVCFYNAGPMIHSTIIYLNYNRANTSKPIEFNTHMEQEFYWLDIRSNFAHYVGFSVCAMVSYVFSAYILVVEASLTYSCCKCCSNMFDVVSLRLKDLSSSKEANHIKANLVDIISMHVDAFQCVELLNSICMFALGIQIFNCALIWCSMAAYLTRNFNANAVNVVVLFFLITAETYGLSVLGTELSHKSDDVQNAIYDYPWYEAPITVRKSLLRMLQRAQKSIGITAAGFCYVNIERFGSLAQTSYSIYVVMKDTLTT